MPDIMWTAPPDIRQDYHDNCWAAVLEAFCAAAPGRPKVKQGPITEQFSKLCVSKTDGTMTRQGLFTMFKDVRFGLKSMEVAPEAFTPLLLSQKLGYGHVILGFWEKRIHGWHVGLAYGIKGNDVSYLNPDFKWGGLGKTPIDTFRTPGKGNLVVAWRAW